MLRVLFLALALTGALAASSAARAADQPVYGPAPAWVKPIPIPKASAAGDSGPTKVLLLSNQTKLTTESDDYYTETATQVLSPQGLGQMGNLQQTWDPATETLLIHKLRVIRGDKTIDLLAGDRKFEVLRRESNLDFAMIDGRLTANFQPEGLQVGDVLDFAYTLQQRDPALQGYSTHFAALGHQGVASRVYFRTLYPTALPIHWKETDGIKAPSVGKQGDLTEVIVDDAEVEAMKFPVGAPARFGDVGIIGFSQYRDWQELSGKFAPLYDKAATLPAGSPLRAEAAKISASTRDPKARALAALRLVEDQVRYVFLGMNDGGLVPAPADDSWSRRFGDCKGKTVLLIALLRELGIEAQPALVNTANGDGMDARLPTVGWFNHVIVRARIGGKTYWLDGTRAGDRSLDTLTIPPFGWALPLSVAGEPLEKLSPPPLAEPGQEQVVTVDASKGAAAPAPTRLTITYRGEYGVAARAQIASLPRADYERALRDSFAKTFSWFSIATVDIKDDVVAGAVEISAAGTGKLDWTEVEGGARIYRVPGTAFSGQIARRQPGLHADAPYLAAFPSYTRNIWRVSLPVGPAYTLFGRDVDRTLAGMTLRRTARLNAGVLFVVSSGRGIAPEWPASEADATIETLRDLGRNDVAVMLPAASAPASSEPLAKPPPRP